MEISKGTRKLMIRLLEEEIGDMPFDEYIKANNTEIVDDFIMRVESEPEPEGDGFYHNETNPNK